jgi:hypothetical protein
LMQAAYWTQLSVSVDAKVNCSLSAMYSKLIRVFADCLHSATGDAVGTAAWRVWAYDEFHG